MKILHIALVDHFTEGMSYQDNLLEQYNVKAGHQVTIISDVYRFIEGDLVKGDEEDRILESGARLIRLKYDSLGIEFLTNKIQKVNRLSKLLEEIKPDTILYHNLCGWSLKVVAKYIKENPKTFFYVDCHSDFNNSARSILAKIAYKYIHGIFVKKAYPYVKKFLCVSQETKNYNIKMYRIPENKMEWFPLGGIMISQEERKNCREKLLKELNMPENSIILCHSGKLSPEKRTKELIQAFLEVPDRRLQLIVIGNIPSQTVGLETLFKADNRIHYLGWKPSEELVRILGATDLYCQPGSQSATMQCAMCAGCVLMLYPHLSYKDYGEEHLFFVKDLNDMVQVFSQIIEIPERLVQMRDSSYAFAQEKLDYVKLGERICR